jgi:hypothetical protein
LLDQQPHQEWDVGATTPTPPNINTTAYERVKATWVRRGIWNTKWGILPGMSWKHEQPQEEFLREEMARQPEFGEPGQPDFTVPEIPKERQQDDPVVPLETNGVGAEEVIPQRSFVSAGVKPLLSPPPGGLGLTLQNPLPTERSPPPEADRTPPPIPRSRPARKKQPPRSPAPLKTQRGTKAPSVKGEATSNHADTALGPVQPSKVPKPRNLGNATRPGRAQASNESIEAGPSAQAPDGPADPPQDADTPRRSRRLLAVEDTGPTGIKGD